MLRLAMCRLFWMVLTSLFLCSTLGNFVSKEIADGISQWITHSAVMFYSSQQGHFLFYHPSWLFANFPVHSSDLMVYLWKITEVVRAGSLMLRMPVSVLLYFFCECMVVFMNIFKGEYGNVCGILNIYIHTLTKSLCSIIFVFQIWLTAAASSEPVSGWRSCRTAKK